MTRAWLVLTCMLAGLSVTQAQDARSLQARYVELRSQLSSNAFQRPLYLESSERAGTLQGDIYALIDQPYAAVGPALQGTAHWCDILILHLNVKSCRASRQTTNALLSVNIGRKFDQPLADAYLFEFVYTMAALAPDYMQTLLAADAGPLNTHHYRILLEVAPLDSQRSFLHLSYAYAYGITARMAMQGYLATVGRDKVGFSIVGNHDGQPVYIGSMRGVVERNTMRYYLAIAAYLGALATPGAQQLEQRLNDWHSSVERYPRQLHELERGEYLAMKHKEIQRQQSLP
jgi:hypothetical protein